MERQMEHAVEELQRLAQELQESRQQTARAEAHRDDVLRALHSSADHAAQERQHLQQEAAKLRATVTVRPRTD